MKTVWLCAENKEIRDGLCLGLLMAGYTVKVKQMEDGKGCWIIIEVPDLNIKNKET